MRRFVDPDGEFLIEDGSQGIKADSVFVGVSISGGGIRAATFGAAVLQELDEAGFLTHLTAISSVSGGSLPAAYYALYRNTKEWKWSAFKAAMARDFLSPFLLRMTLPTNILLSAFTSYNRSSIMGELFDKELFHNATFGDLKKTTSPLLLVTATSISRPGSPFVFDPRHFRQLSSDFDTFPIAQAVMASGAFPGVFNDVTLARFAVTHLPDDRKDYHAALRSESSYYKFATSHIEYEHLIDGGPTDNLGLAAMLEVARRQSHRNTIVNKSALKGCLIISIDSATIHNDTTRSAQRDMRSWYDFIIDTNVLQATDALLYGQRSATLASFLKARYSKIGHINLFSQFDLTVSVNQRSESCMIWHISFESLDRFYRDEDEQEFTSRMDLRRIVGSIVTNYKLQGPRHCSSAFLQDALYDAAHYLVHFAGHGDYARICKYAADLGLGPLDCLPVDFTVEGRPPPTDLLPVYMISPHNKSPAIRGDSDWQSVPFECD